MTCSRLVLIIIINLHLYLIKNITYSSTSCPKCGTHFPACIASGKSLMNPVESWQCSTCHHCASPMEISNRRTCPLCHTNILNKNIDN